MKTYTNVFDLGDLKQALAEAFEIKQDRYKYEALGRHKTCLLIIVSVHALVHRRPLVTWVWM